MSPASQATPVECTFAQLEAMVDFVLDNFAEEITLEQMAEAAQMTRFSLCRRFQNHFGMSPMKWLWQFRAHLANEFIAIVPEWSLTDIAFSCGFTSSAHFSRLFKSTFGKTATHARREAALVTKPCAAAFDKVNGDDRDYVLAILRGTLAAQAAGRLSRTDAVASVTTL